MNPRAKFICIRPTNQLTQIAALLVLLTAIPLASCSKPRDFYRGIAPKLSIVGGTGQIGPPGGFVPVPLVVQVTDPDGGRIEGAPVIFRVASGGGSLQASSGGAPGTSVTADTDELGNAQMFFQLPNKKRSTSHIIAVTGTFSSQVQVQFDASSDDGTGQFFSPFAPSNSLGSVNSDGSLTLTWTNNSDNETAIVVEQQQKDGSWLPVAKLPPGATSYRVKSPASDPYRIDAKLPGEK